MKVEDRVRVRTCGDWYGFEVFDGVGYEAFGVGDSDYGTCEVVADFSPEHLVRVLRKAFADEGDEE